MTAFINSSRTATRGYDSTFFSRSADAAAVLVALNDLWQAGVPRRELYALAAQLGSDVPFALRGGTALGTGRGEELATVLARSTFHWVLAFAGGSLATPALVLWGDEDRALSVGTVPESFRMVFDQSSISGIRRASKIASE